MKERPILFSAPMVRAILDGSKTQTRRFCKNQPHDGADLCLCHQKGCGGNRKWHMLSPYGQPGDMLWVRETFALTGDNASPIVHPVHGGVAWRATDHPEAFKWTPSIFMPRWASRITLEVVSIRVEQLQDISEADAWAEGVAKSGVCYGKKILPSTATGIERYRALWESINGPGSWNENPWVWVVEFKRI